MTTENIERLFRERLSYRPGGEVTPDNVGEFLVYKAKSSPQIRSAIAEALLAPWPQPSRLPRCGGRDLLFALRVSAWGLDLCETETTRADAWFRIVRALLVLIQFQDQPPPSGKDVIRARPILEIAAEYCDIDLTVLEELLAGLIDAEIHVPNTHHSHPGRRFSARDQRLLAAIMLFQECEETKQIARVTVSELLYTQGRKLEADSLERLEERYRRALKRRRQDANIPLEHLTKFWLNRLGDLIMVLDLPAKPCKFVAPSPVLIFRHRRHLRPVRGRSRDSMSSSHIVPPTKASALDPILLNDLRQLRYLVPEIPQITAQTARPRGG
jgi:hypothetical protein